MSRLQQTLSANHRRNLYLLGCLVGLIACFISFYKLGSHSTFGSHEVYAAIPARGMLSSGDWVVPRIGGEVRLKKPPLGYWVVAGSAALFGGVNEWSARFPAALSALALTALIGFWGTRRYGPLGGIIAALVQCSSVYVIIFARKAEVDMLLCLFTTAALYLVVTQPPRENYRTGFWRWNAIYALLALSWLAKFHFGIAMVLGPAVIFFVVQRRFHTFVHLLNPLGILLLLAAVLIWPYLVLQRIPGAWQVWWTETVGRAIGDLGNNPWWFFLPQILWRTLPWTPLIIAALPSSWRLVRHEKDAHERFLWIWFLVDLAIMSASADKHPNYLNALLPALSLIAGRYLAQRIQTRGKSLFDLSRLRFWGLLALGLIGPTALVMLLVPEYPYTGPALISVGGILLGATCLAAIFLKRQRLGVAAVCVLFGFIGCYVGVMGWIMPAQDHRLAARNFVESVRKEYDGREICAFCMNMTTVEYYLGEPVRRIESVAALQQYLQRKGDLLVVAYETALKDFSPFAIVTRYKTMQPVPAHAPAKHPPLVLVELETV